MAVCYKKLFHAMLEQDITNAQLMKKAGFSANIITRMKRGCYISLDCIERICPVMNCGVDDRVELTEKTLPEEKQKKT